MVKNKFHINLLFSLILTFISAIVFWLRGATAYEWPSIDMGPFFERQMNHDFLKNDFFTNVSSIANPRQIFGYFVIYLGKLLGVNWYSVFFLLKVIFVIIIPPLYYAVIISLVKDKINSAKKLKVASIVAFIFVASILFYPFSMVLSVAWWEPIIFTATPQTLSMVLGLLAILFDKIKHSYHVAVILWVAATLVHPSVGVFMLFFYLLVSYDKILSSKFKIVAYGGIGVILPMFFLLINFKSQVTLSAIEFTKHYAIENHTSHYMPSHFGSLISFIPWYLSAGVIILGMIICWFIGFKYKNNYLKTLSLLFIISYIGSIFLQYISVEAYPVKFIVALGPSRFTFLGYWMLAILCILSVLELRTISGFLGKLSIKSISNKLFIITVIFLSISIFLLKDNPFLSIKQKNLSFYSWVEKSTNKDEVFATYPGSLSKDLPLVGNRAVFTGNGFPFSEDSFVEFDQRQSLVFGTFSQIQELPGNWIGEKNINFYRNLEPNDFLNISKKYRLDYVVIEKKYNKKFLGFTPVYQDKDISIYKILDFLKGI